MENNEFRLMLNQFAIVPQKSFNQCFASYSHINDIPFELKLACANICTVPHLVSISCRMYLMFFKPGFSSQGVEFWLKSLNENKAKLVDNLNELDQFEHWTVAGARSMAESLIGFIDQLISSFIQISDKK